MRVGHIRTLVRHRNGQRACLFALTVCSFACTKPSEPFVPDTDDGANYWPDSSWRTTAPRNVGMSASRMSSLVTKIQRGTYPTLDALVVVKNGYVVLEEYRNGNTRETLHTMQSVTKSITSLLMGIAIDRGKIFGTSDNFLGYFPQYTDLQNLNDWKRAITLRDVLTMTSGLDFYEEPYEGSPLQQLNQSTGDWLRIILDRPMNAEPGSVWQYNSGGVIALGGVLLKATGVAASSFAREALFDPIGAGQANWFVGKPDTLPHMGGGLRIRAIDLARVGYLVLRKGKWGGTQVISESWLRTSTARIVRHPRSFGSYPVDYGYLWWLLSPTDSTAEGWDADVITASGAYGQWLFVIPKHDIVVAATSTQTANARFLDPLSILYSEILPSLP
jgi:CubicO group peptidase (beta-lactamase class C family)